MIIKPREVPTDLIRMRYLFFRGGLSEKEKQVLSNIEKGFEGELQFDVLLEESLSSDCFIINDLLLQWHNSHFQIDSLLIINSKIYIFDTKNYEGDYYIEGDQLFTFFGTELKNPLPQLQRASSLLRQLLQSFEYILPMESHVVFVHPEFTLYQAPRNLPIILPSQIHRFLKRLKMIKPIPSKSDLELANKLCSLHINESPFSRVPPYQYEKLKKGIYCGVCHAFSLKNADRKLVCLECGSVETLEAGIMRIVQEYHILFPERKITVRAIKEFCGKEVNIRTIGRVLKSRFDLVYMGGHSYYLYPEKE